jgi:serine/threonine-protein kinase
VPRISERLPVPAAVDAVLQRSLEKTPARRYASVHELLADLGMAVLAPQAAERQVATVGVYVHACMPEGLPGGGDALLDDLERVLSEARSALASVNLPLALESADAVLGAAPLPEGDEEGARFRRAILQMAVTLARGLDGRPGAQARVSITAHVAPAVIGLHRGRPVLSGPLLRVHDWAGQTGAGAVVATTPMLAGLEASFTTDAIAPGRWTVRG